MVTRMDPNVRPRFNQIFSEDLYRRYCTDLEQRVGGPIGFRLAETPLFLPADLREKLVTASEEILSRICAPNLIAGMRRAVPPEWISPLVEELSSFLCLDFAIVREDDGTLGPRLIELQGFPSLTSFTTLQFDSWSSILAECGVGDDWSCWFSGLDRERFLALARRTILGDHDPKEVVLVDIDPPNQKTNCDFLAARSLFGIDAIDPSEILVDGRSLSRRDSETGMRIPIRRIHNRVIVDELARKGRRLPFDIRDDLDVEWAAHPDWYFIWSKSSLPLIHHPSVPRMTRLSDLGFIPDDLTERYVLKPLYSFAGSGVNVDPTKQDLQAIPQSEKRNWCIQEKIVYDPAIPAADGWGVKAEVRMMFFRPDDEERPILGMNLVRLSRGKMLGVDFNKDFTWVGSTVAMWV